VDTPSTDQLRRQFSHIDNYGDEYCIQFWETREVTFLQGRCKGE
jgi:hypothetical protein